MTRREELLLFLGLPPQARAGEIEFVYLERRAAAEKRLRHGDKRARAEIDRLESVFKRLEDLGADAAESEAVPVAVMTAKGKPALMRSAGADREANGSLMCGIAACLIVLWAFFVYRADLRGSSADVLGLLQSPLYFAIYLLTLAAEVLSHASLSDASRARFLVKFGLRAFRLARRERDLTCQSRALSGSGSPRRSPFCWRSCSCLRSPTSYGADPRDGVARTTPDSVKPLPFLSRRVHYAAGYGSPEAKNIEDETRQAPHPSGARSTAPERLPGLPAAQASSPYVPDLQALPGPRGRAAAGRGALALRRRPRAVIFRLT